MLFAAPYLLRRLPDNGFLGQFPSKQLGDRCLFPHYQFATFSRLWDRRVLQAVHGGDELLARLQ